VVGQVIARSGENWRVDIGSAQMATLDGLAFEGATKRNRPNLKAGLFSFHRPTA
jgi:exosome complex component RRP40